MAVTSEEAAQLLNEAFRDRGPDNPRVAFAIGGGGQVHVTLTARDGGDVVAEHTQPWPALAPVEVGSNRYRAFAHGTAMAARQVAASEDPAELFADTFLCPELLGIADLNTADGFRRAAMDEGGQRTRVRAETHARTLAAQHGVAAPGDEEALLLLYELGDPYDDGGFREQCAALRRLITERQDLLPHLAAIVQDWSAEPDDWWPTDPESDTSGPRLLAGLVRALLDQVPAQHRPTIEASLARFDGVGSEDELRNLELL